MTMVACVRAFVLAGIPIFHELLEVLELSLALLSCKKSFVSFARMQEAKSSSAQHTIVPRRYAVLLLANLAVDLLRLPPRLLLVSNRLSPSP
jgi:hypothetical protein